MLPEAIVADTQQGLRPGGEPSQSSSALQIGAHCMGCQVIGAGWCRTGTSSLQVALEALGFAPCFHSRLLPYLPGVRDACYEHSRGGAGKFPVERVFGRYRAAVDLPAALIPPLLDAYPNAKVPPCCVV